MKQNKKAMRPFWKCMLLGLLCGVVIVGALLLIDPFSEDTYEGSEDTYEGDGFQSPEAAVRGYLEALRDCDTEAMQKTFAIETMMEHYDVAEYWTFTAVDWSTSAPNINLLPSDFPFGCDLMTESRLASLANDIVSPFYMAAEGAFEDLAAYSQSYYPNISDPDEIEAFYEKHRRSDYEPILSSIVINDVYELSSSNPESKSAEAWAKIYGADDCRFYVAEVEVDGNACYFGMTVVCYDGVWYNAHCATYSVGCYCCGGFDYEI